MESRPPSCWKAYSPLSLLSSESPNKGGGEAESCMDTQVRSTFLWEMCFASTSWNDLASGLAPRIWSPNSAPKDDPVRVEALLFHLSSSLALFHIKVGKEIKHGDRERLDFRVTQCCRWEADSAGKEGTTTHSSLAKYAITGMSYLVV